jgi:hypothetical protein
MSAIGALTEDQQTDCVVRNVMNCHRFARHLEAIENGNRRGVYEQQAIYGRVQAQNMCNQMPQVSEFVNLLQNVWILSYNNSGWVSVDSWISWA